MVGVSLWLLARIGLSVVAISFLVVCTHAHQGNATPPCSQDGKDDMCGPFRIGQEHCVWNPKNQIANFTSYSYRDCCAACKANPDCQSWYFIIFDTSCRLSSDSAMQGKPTASCYSGGRSQPPSPSPPPPPFPKNALNVLYFVVDDFRPEMHKAYGQSQLITPNLDTLASESLVFDNAYCQMAVCSPSRNSFMSGRRPKTTRVFTNNRISFRDVGPNWITMPEHFKKHGFLTLGGGKTYHPNSPPDWDEPKSWSQEFPYYRFHMSHCPDFTAELGTWCALNGTLDQFYDYRLANSTMALLDYAKQQRDATQRPFFIMAGMRRPHGPWKVPTQYWDLYNTKDIELATNMNYTKDAPLLAYFATSLWRPPTDASGRPGGPGNYQMYNTTPFEPVAFQVQREARHAYYAAVSWTDSQVGRILNHLKKLDLYESTIVVIHGDHGYHLGEHNMFHKFTNFELTARTPLLMRVPNKPKSIGTRTKVLAELVDMYPTLARLAHTPSPTDDLEGTDISSVFDDPNDTSSKEFAFSQYPRCVGATSWRYNNCGGAGSSKKMGLMGMTVRNSTLRFTAWVPWDPKSQKTNWTAGPYAVELYPHDPALDHCSDDFNTCENANLAKVPKYAEAIETLYKAIKKRFQD